jgi:hypothetical protein
VLHGVLLLKFDCKGQKYVENHEKGPFCFHGYVVLVECGVIGGPFAGAGPATGLLRLNLELQRKPDHSRHENAYE